MRLPLGVCHHSIRVLHPLLAHRVRFRKTYPSDFNCSRVIDATLRVLLFLSDVRVRLSRPVCTPPLGLSSVPPPSGRFSPVLSRHVHGSSSVSVPASAG